MTKNLLAALAFAILPQLASAQAHVELTPSFNSVAQGETFSVLVHGQGFNTTPAGLVVDNFQGGQSVAFSFDASKLELLSVNVDTGWSFRRLPGTINNVAGTLTGMAFLASPALVPQGPDYAFNFATLQFRALDAGDASIAVTGGTFVGRVAGQAAQRVNPTLDTTLVTVTAVVPEPGTAWMLMAGALGLVALGKRRGAVLRD
ncbi:MAG: PEP-CTERM sorting domain-containing protein [Burkholderiales bacterium]|nr:PEP-CTERM sorting domain-containing protein [Burkholderiales bacterium]